MILVASAGIVGGAFYFRKSQIPQPTITSTPIPSLTPSSAPDETANWLKLNNSSCSLSLQYPPTWIVKMNKEGTNKSVGIAWDGCIIQVKNNETEYIIITSMAPTKTWQEVQESLSRGVEDSNAKGFKEKISEIKINGQIYTSKLDETMPQLTQLGAYFRNADQFFSVIGYYVPNTESQNNFYKILESIKFK